MQSLTEFVAGWWAQYGLANPASIDMYFKRRHMFRYYIPTTVHDIRIKMAEHFGFDSVSELNAALDVEFEKLGSKQIDFIPNPFDRE